MSSPPKITLEKIILVRKAEINETLIQELLVELWDYDGKFSLKCLICSPWKSSYSWKLWVVRAFLLSQLKTIFETKTF